MKKYVEGWFVTTIAYLLCLFVTVQAYMLMTGLPVDRQRHISGAIIGFSVLILPYIAAGLYARKQFARPRQGAFWISIAPVVGERVLLFLIGATFVASGGDGGGDGIVNWTSVLQFVGAEALPYYTNTYIASGIVSIAVCIAAASIRKSEKGQL
ncbi:hypothetical protein ACJ7K1_00840 [Paenibacillus elgii]